MGAYKSFAGLLIVLFVLCGFRSNAQQSNADISRRIDSLVNIAVSMQLFSGDVLIANGNKIIYEKAFGKADYENNTPNTLSTQFQIGSITKDFTKVMALQLIEQHKLSATDTIGKFLPDFPSRLAGITVHQLLMHKSGLGSYTDAPPFGEDPEAVNQIKTISDILPYIKKGELNFKPGTKALYSNSGYVLLAAIIEKATGKKYYEVLKQQILDKLNMMHTGFSAYVKSADGKATGYLSNSLGPLQSNTDMHIIGGGDGGIYMTAHDLLAFVNSLLYDNKLFTNDSKQIAFTNPFSDKPAQGWADFRKTGKIALAGGAPGLSAVWSADMMTGNIVIALSNFDEGTAEQLYRRIAAVLTNRPVIPFKLPAAKYLYEVINAKGGQYFEGNYKAEMKNSGMEMDNDMVLLDVGRDLLEKNETDKAISLYKVYTSEFPQIVVAWNDLADAYLKKDDKANAKKCYRQALILRPGNPRATRALEGLK